MRNRLGIGLIALIFLLAMPMFAQIGSGIISGRITDSSGAVVPNAQIIITQTDTNVDTPSATNSDAGSVVSICTMASTVRPVSAMVRTR